MGKPLGLGTVRIDMVGVFLTDRNKRYKVDDLFDSPRYHQAHLSPETQFDRSWTIRYPVEAESPPTSTDEPFIHQLVHELRKDNNHAVQRRALELLGDPSGIGSVPVHYPQIPGPKEGTARFEQERFKWFVANDRKSATEQQSLRPLLDDQLKPLDRT